MGASEDALSSITCAHISRPSSRARRMRPHSSRYDDSNMTGFVVFAHGSRIETANEAVREVAARMARSGGHAVEPAFLELGKPDLAGAVERLMARGVVRIIVI